MERDPNGCVPMNTTSQIAEALQSAFASPTRGIAGMVDDLLRLCPVHGLRLAWHGDRCRVQSPAGGSETELAAPLPKSAFRALLARIAALSNERQANAVSPYGGKGLIGTHCNPPAMFQVAFANTTAEQWLELKPIGANGAVVTEKPALESPATAQQ
jgi:hypothetical protein